MIFFAGIIIFIFFLNNNALAQKMLPLIEREVLTEEPKSSGVRLSPDGKFMSFLRPSRGTMNLWIKERNALTEQAIQVTSFGRPVLSYFWTRDSRFLLFIIDKAGDDNYNIFAVNPAEVIKGRSGGPRAITDLESVQVKIFHVSRIDPDLLFIGPNHRDKNWHDLYSLKISSGELSLLRENTSRYTSWIFDNEDKLRLAISSLPFGINELWRFEPGKKEKLLTKWDTRKTAYSLGFKADNQNLYFVSNAVDNTRFTQLYVLDVETGKFELLEKDPEGISDFGAMVCSDKKREIIFTYYTCKKPRYYFSNLEFKKHFDHLKQKSNDF
jgi:hypothetical protein